MPHALPIPVIDLKAFVPAKDFAPSQQFYADLGFRTQWADVWWQHIETLGFRNKYPGIMLKPPELQPWGLRVLYLSDPSGVLWHIADRRS
jgi:hypothetical protein